MNRLKEREMPRRRDAGQGGVDVQAASRWGEKSDGTLMNDRGGEVLWG